MFSVEVIYMAKETLSFYDLRAKKKFNTSNYTIVTKGGRHFAVAKAPSGVDSYRIVSASQK